MPRKPKHQSQSFDDLINNISIIFTQGLINAQKAVQYQRIKTYWKVGGKMGRYLRSPQNKFKTTEEFYQKTKPVLLKKIGIDLSVDMLRRIVQFRHNYPQLPPKSSLTFTHYKALQRITDPEIRKKIEQQAIKEKLTFKDIDLIVKQLKLKQSARKKTSKKGILTFTRGEPYIYRIHKNNDITGCSEYYLDLGFHFSGPIPDSYTSQLNSGRLVRLTKNKDRTYSLTRAEERHDMLYTYPARVAKIVDGDTIDAHINVGSGHYLIKERLRFRGINAPELSTPEGIVAKAFLKKYLSKCPIIVIRTTKNNAQASANAKGMFGRWLVDVFAKPGVKGPSIIARKGTYINQLLIDKGFAEPY